jgi:hypothetical protein
MLADMQRARALAWELPGLGWDVEILAPAGTEVRQDAIEPDPDAFFAPATPVHEVRAWFPSVLRLLTLQSGTWRMWLPMFWRGRALLASGRFDLVYLTTTAFNFFVFGHLWRRRFGIPYVLDFQDPWVTPGTGSFRKGWKARISALLDPVLEKKAVLDAAGFIAVSDDYIRALARRYRSQSPVWLQAGRHAVVPFCALERDLVEAARARPSAAPPQSAELALHYVGAGPTMQRSFTLICRALSHLRSHGVGLAERARIRLFGTGSLGQQGDARILQEIAREAGVGDLVEERPQRVPYRRALELVLESDGLLILGVDDAGYIPSKLFGYAQSGLPLLASLRRDGPAFAEFQAHPELGHVLWFDAAGSMPLDEAAAVFEGFLQQAAAGVRVDRKAVLERHSAPAMARRHVEIFEACLATSAIQS